MKLKLACLLLALPVLAPFAEAGEAHRIRVRLSQAQYRFFHSTEEDALDKRVCVGTRKRVTLSCRDERSYVRMNEWYHEVFHPYIENLEGGYVGVGSDQGLTFVAWAKSEFAWLIDYDPVVVRVNSIHRAFVLHAESPKEFVRLWSRPGQAKPVIERAFRGQGEHEQLWRTYRYYRKEVSNAFERVMRLKKNKRSHWLHSPEDYAYIRHMYQTSRIRVMGGDLLKTRSLAGIAKAARRLRTAIRVVYLSNAEEFWPYTGVFRSNVARLPMDQRSVILRTRHSGKYGPKIGSYVYVVQGGRDFQRRLEQRSTRGVWSMMFDRFQPGRPGFFTIGMQGERSQSGNSTTAGVRLRP